MAKKQKKIVLDEYEKEILEAYENGMLKPSKSQADYQKIVRNTMKKANVCPGKACSTGFDREKRWCMAYR